jgi:4'-phosphopantetheinyl transferase
MQLMMEKIPDIGLKEVHLWSICLDQTGSSVNDFASILSKEEYNRANSYISETIRRRYIVSHGFLRIILGSYFSREPQEVHIRYACFGKPYLTDHLDQEIIQFSMSHSEEQALFAFAQKNRVGIDLEQIRELPNMEQIVKRYFSARENAEFLQLLPQHRLIGFFNGWTRKEAFVKAIGRGMTFPLRKIEVTLSPNIRAELLNAEGYPELLLSWSLYHLEPAPGYLAALAVEGQNFEIKPYYAGSLLG